MERWAKREKCQAIRGGRCQTGSKRSKRHRQKCSFPSWHKNSVVFLKDNFKCQRSHQTEHQFRSADTGGARFLLGEIKDWQIGWLRMLRRFAKLAPRTAKTTVVFDGCDIVHWRGICPFRGSKAPFVVSVIGMAEDIREWLSRSYKILRKEEQNGTNLGKTAWIDKFYHFLTFKYSCTIRTLRKVGTDATTTLNEGLFAGESKAYFRFTKRRVKRISLSQEACVSRVTFLQALSFHPYLLTLLTQTRTRACALLCRVSHAEGCRSITAIELRYHWLPWIPI